MAVWATSDLHGCLDAWKAIKTIVKPDDKIFVLGDCSDRGPQPWETLKTIYSDPQAILLKGNHEDMLVKAMKDYINYDGQCDRDYYRLASNGGAETFQQWSYLSPEMQNVWMRHLDKLPTVQEYTNENGFRIIMTHAGFTPVYNADDEIVIPDDHDAIWDREHFNDPWPHQTDNVIIVHGHTPTILLAEELQLPREELEPGALWYAKNHKICIDCGCVFTGYACLLNLDTFDEEVIVL